jgi:DNA-directed RNA polymerase subunit RPC12/RpoP
MKIHKSVTIERILDAVENDEMLGICASCGEDYESNVEPDARRIECGECGECAVYGAEELLIMTGAF